MTVRFCNSFSLDLLTGTHVFGSDTFKMALFDGNASFDATTTAYTTANELADGDGYTTGGAPLTVTLGYPQFVTSADVRFENPSWTFSAPKSVRWALLHNASKANKSVLSIDLGMRSVSGPFDIQFPLSMSALIALRLSV